MAYGRKYTPRKSPRTATPRATPRKYTPRRNYRKKMPMVSFTKRVEKIIASNLENKQTNTITYDAPVSTVVQGSPDVYTFYTWAPGGNSTTGRLFNLQNNSTAALGQDGRIGNTIKLKRWIIKGIIEPVTDASEQMLGGMTGYVDIYFGRFISQLTPVPDGLPRLYQNGASATSPTCTSTDMLQALNKDEYKVYYHRRFKMGAQFDLTNQTTAGLIAPANNDFKLSQTFGFDVCKHVMKNRHIKYPLTTTGGTAPFDAPTDNDVLNLTLWATFTPWTKQALPQSTGTFKTLYHINALTYAEYEDA